MAAKKIQSRTIDNKLKLKISLKTQVQWGFEIWAFKLRNYRVSGLPSSPLLNNSPVFKP